MKNIITILIMCVGLFANAQTLENAFILNDSTVKVGYSVSGEMSYKEVLKADLTSYSSFVSYCNSESSLTLDNFICQFTKEQTLSNQFSERIWVKQEEEAVSIQSPSNSAYTAFKNELQTLITE